MQSIFEKPHHPARAMRPELDTLLEIALPAAQDRLRKTHYLVPFAVRLDAHGAVHLEEFGPAQRRARAPEAAQALQERLRRHAREGTLRAAALCSCGTVRHPERHAVHESIIITIEHHAGLVARICQPFHKDLFGLYHFGLLFTLTGEPCIFTVDG